MDDEQMEVVEHFKYVGLLKSADGNLVRSLVCTVLMYGAVCWTLMEADEKRIESADMWIYRGMFRVSWTEHRTYQSIQTASRNGCAPQALVTQSEMAVQ